LIDPVIQTENPSKSFAKPSTYRRDIWPSRKEARHKFIGSKFYQSWDPRVLDKWVKHGLRDLPTDVYPDPVDASKDAPVTLTTPKAQEVFSYLRPKYLGTANINPLDDREAYGDIHPDDYEPDYPFYRPEPAEIYRRLSELKPPVQYIFGEHSPLATPDLRAKKMATTGVGVGGSGGFQRGMVEEAVLNCGHLVPFEKVVQCADAAATFTVSALAWWEKSLGRVKKWEGKSRQERVGIDDEWRRYIGERDSRK
jgi:pimeloyl-ACP methyl ester carboxylesterase